VTTAGSTTASRLLPPLRVAFLVWGLGAALYLIGFFQRVAPAVITRELSTEFALTAASLGNLAAVYYYSYVAMQIPTGIVVDRWGPRRVIAIGAAVAAAGTFLFAASSSFGLVALGRLMIGASVGVAFVAMLKLSTHWFHSSRFAAVAGLALAAGVIGAVSAGAPLRLAVDAFGWRAVIAAAGVVTAVLAIAAWLLVRDDPAERGYASYMPASHTASPPHSMLGGMRTVLRSRNVWLIFLINGGVSGPPLTFAGLWGVPFLTTHYGLSTAQAGGVASLLLVAWAGGGPFVGVLSDRVRRRKPIYVTGAVIATLAWTGVFLIRGLPLPVLIGLLLLAGVSASVVMVGFAYAKESAPVRLAGSTSGVINMGNMLGGMIMQPAVGWVLDRYWDGGLNAGARVYPFEGYRAGFSLMLAWLVVASVCAMLTKDTRCRQTP
jgi:sugar phosphate permease